MTKFIFKLEIYSETPIFSDPKRFRHNSRGSVSKFIDFQSCPEPLSCIKCIYTYRYKVHGELAAINYDVPTDLYRLYICSDWENYFCNGGKGAELACPINKHFCKYLGPGWFVF